MQADRNTLHRLPEARSDDFGRACPCFLHRILRADAALALQFLACDPYKFVRAFSGKTVKVYTWHPCSTYVMFYLFGPESLGGMGNIRLKAEEIARKTGRTFEEVAKQVMFIPCHTWSRVLRSCSWSSLPKRIRLSAYQDYHQCIRTNTSHRMSVRISTLGTTITQTDYGDRAV